MKYLRRIPITSHTSHPSPWNLRWVGLVVQNTHASGTRIILRLSTNKKSVGRIIRNEHQSSSNYVGQKFGEILQNVHFSRLQLFCFFLKGRIFIRIRTCVVDIFRAEFWKGRTSAPMVTLTPASSSKTSSLVVFQEMAGGMTQQPNPNLTDGWWNDKLRKKSVETLWNCVKAISWSNMNEDSIYLLYVFRCFRCINQMYV